MRALLHHAKLSAMRDPDPARRILLESLIAAVETIYRRAGELAILGQPPPVVLPSNTLEIMRTLKPNEARGTKRWQEVMRLVILAALVECADNKKLAAQWMGISRSLIYDWIERFGVHK